MRRLKSVNEDLLWQHLKNQLWFAFDHGGFNRNAAYALLNFGSAEISLCNVSMVEKSAMPSTREGRK